MTADTEILRYSAVRAKLYTEDLAAHLTRVCIPLADAQPGDLLGVIQDFGTLHSTRGFPITHFIVLGEDTPRHVAYKDLPEALKPEAALLAMAVQTPGALHQDSLHQVCNQLDPNIGETFYTALYMVPDLALLAVENYADEIFEGRYFDEDRDQEQIDDAFRVIANCGDSAHKALAAQARLLDAAPIFAALCPVHDPDGQILSLAVPDLNAAPTS